MKKTDKQIKLFDHWLSGLTDNPLVLLEPREHMDKAILGLTNDLNHIVYSQDKIVTAFMKMNRWNYEEAVEWYDYNTLRALDYMGEFKPVIVIQP